MFTGFYSCLWLLNQIKSMLNVSDDSLYSGLLVFLDFVHRLIFCKHTGSGTWLSARFMANFSFFLSSSSLGSTALREPWPPVLFASPGLYPELSFSILQSPSLVGPLERHLTI